MKKIFALILMSLAVINITSCISYHNHSYNRVFNPSSDSLYIQCKELKGLGQLHIGNTLKQVENNFKQHSEKGWVHTSFIGGEWDVNDSHPFELIHYIEKNATNIKQCYVYDYKIGEVSIGKVSCAFYKNALVAISFDCSSEMLKQFISKYGDGKGFKSDIEKGFPWYYERLYKIYHYHEKNEKRIWSNENVTMEYNSHSINHKKFMSDEHIINWSSSCIITSNDDRYNKFLEELEMYKEQYKKEKEAKRQSSLNQL